VGEIETAYPLIHNKVTSPHYVTPTLRRARLIDWLNERSNCRALVIAAEAGYGKTTLLWQWEQEVDFDCYWYKLDRSDRDWSLHISYLIEAIARRHPGFGHRAHSMLRQIGGPGSGRPGVAAFLLSEMHERLTEPCTFIIDDWQAVASQTEVRGLWNQILRDAPPTCRFIFLSRARPQLQFARFRTHGGYGELRTDALRFTEPEIAALFRDIYSDPLDPAELLELDRRTEGWAASLQLVEVSLRDKVGAARRTFIESISASSDSDLFAFLAEEVLDQQPEETRNFLLCTSILQQITPDLAERLTGVVDGSQMLSDLEQRGLFTNRLGDDEERYRFHGLFREFLERRLAIERTTSEVIGLHIHAASYYETTLQWPLAIHHYLRAGLQRQAARLLARYGEDVVAEGRLGLIDEWLAQLPKKTIRDNARLSLLHGEALGTIRGEWEPALSAIERGRAFFLRKGDRRMVALADLKASTHYNYRGEAARSAEAAARGLSVVGEENFETRLRLRGNLTITTTWLESLEQTERECRELVLEADSKGLTHFAAIGRHNLGLVQQYMGRLTESLANFEEADRFWRMVPSSPFGDNGDFVVSILAVGDLARAELVASEAEGRTRNWPRPHAEAICASAAVLVQRGEFDEAIAALRPLFARREMLGGLAEAALIQLIGALYLVRGAKPEMEWALELLNGGDGDPRLSAQAAVANALAAHAMDRCTGQCRAAMEELNAWEARGARFVAACGMVQVTPLLMEHPRSNASQAVAAISRAESFGSLAYLRWWLRRFSGIASRVSKEEGGLARILRIAESDFAFWAPTLVDLLKDGNAPLRQNVLALIRERGDGGTADQLVGAKGTDIAEVRQHLLRRSADRLFIRTFGPMTIHRNSWDGPEVRVDKRRLRQLLGLLVANKQRTLTREMALDVLWPDHDPAAGTNNLNQAVFQLRRYLGGEARDPDRPQYVLSSPDALALDADLTVTDLDEVRRLSSVLAGATTAVERQAAAAEILSLVRGEFLADLRYEDWTTSFQTSVAAEVRSPLLLIATGRQGDVAPHLSLQAAELLTEFDPYDEPAQVAMARKLYEMGRRSAARKLITEFAASIYEEMEVSPSADVNQALVDLGARDVRAVH
jgi:ATP/maltotriose-dependent transcriptional regulator MalT/DNA-binding SARP family transcriptional activator